MFRKSLLLVVGVVALGVAGGCTSCGERPFLDRLRVFRPASRCDCEGPPMHYDGPAVTEPGPPLLMGPSGQPPINGNGSHPAPFPRLVPQPQAQPTPANPSKLIH